MFKKFALPLVAVLGLVFALKTVADGQRPTPVSPLLVQPPRNPFFATVAGAGIIEARCENVSIGSPIAGVIVEVSVKVGDRVERGAPLFGLDDRAQRADLGVRRAALAAAEARLERLKQAPRPESLPPARARVAEARAQLDDLKAQLARWEAVSDKRAVSADEVSRKRFSVAVAETQLARAQAELTELEAGSWAADVRVAEAELASAKADVERAQTELERLVIRAPSLGRVLQLNVRPGEFAQAGPATAGGPLVLLGDVDTLHVRVDIDEGDTSYFQPGAKAVASPKGRPEVKIPLKFVRVEPFVVPKRSLTGLSSERVDTRVLQVIYAVDGASPVSLYVGQQVDAFIEAKDPNAQS
jgi:multidrug resistance efflux pump